MPRKRRGRRWRISHPALWSAFIVLAAAGGALTGVAVIGPFGSVLGALPPTIVAVWQVWDDRRQRDEIRLEISRAIRDNEDARRWDAMLDRFGG
jgi:hypothetical protein